MSLDLKTVCEKLGEVTYKWFKIGIQLGIPYHKLMEFREESEPFIAVINYWLKGNVEDVPLIWSSIVTALSSRFVGEVGLARRISKECYCHDGEEQGNKVSWF